MKRETTGPTATQRAIRQGRRFSSLQQEAVVALLLAAEAVRGRFAALIGGRDDITVQQYNVLRILRGAGDEGLPTLEIVERMIEQTPGITRLIDRLEEKRLVERLRVERDRRQVWCRLTKAGGKLLAELDAPVEALDGEVMECLSAKELAAFVALLVRVRAHQVER